MNLDGSPAIPMTTNVNKLVGYLEVIVSELVWLDSSDRLIGSGSVMTRDSSRDLGLVSGKSERGYHLYTLPLIS